MQETRRQVNRVLVITFVLNIAVALGKIIMGLITGALAITADGFHSLADSASNVVAFIANTIAGRPPDANHPYGHQRFESLAALGIGLLLLLTAWEMTRGLIERLSGDSVPELTALAFIVMIVTLVINIGVNRYQVAQGKRLGSQLLLADAAHTGTDILVTLSVLVSMTLVVAFEWYWADTVIALVVVALIIRASWKIVRETGGVLVDTAPYTPEQIADSLDNLPFSQDIARVRSRGAPGEAYIDVDVRVAPEMTAEHGAAIADSIEESLRSQLEGVGEVSVQFVPEQREERDYALIVRAAADPLGLATHNVRLNRSAEGDMLELHVEVPPACTLDEAHSRVSELEQRVAERTSELREIITHIEPSPSDQQGTDVVIPPDAEMITARAHAILNRLHPDVNWHHLRVYEITPDNRDSTAAVRSLAVTMHAALPASTSLEDAHEIAESAERQLLTELPALTRVTIHTEPDS
jgi:cation diffusion facilitator family transporter